MAALLQMRNIRVFLISFVFVFIMAALPHLGIKTNLVNPLPKKIDIFDKVEPALKTRVDQFRLNKDHSIIGKAEAGGDYDQARSYALVDFQTGDIVAQKNLSEKTPIASLTKIMTAVVALDLASSDELFSVSENATKQPATRFAFSVGDKLSVEELLNAVLLTSANDCAQVIKEGIDQKYGGDVFIRAMNEKARILGLKNTHFENPQGFDGQYHYSSVEDLALLTHYALTQYPLIASIAAKNHAQILPTEGHVREEYLNNWNGLLGVYPGISGVKIGNTSKALYTTAVVSEREGKKLIAVLLGAPGVLERDLWTADLLDFGFSKYGISPVHITEQDLKEKYATWKYPQ
jgi:serine-type D-Ala-D-Ala carboxypeptidase (penicillin-binding protein 5/6)